MNRPHPTLAQLHGVWRRTFVREADGSTDRSTIATWLQGPSLFADLRQPPGLAETVARSYLHDLDRPQLLALCEQRAFAGALVEGDDAFSWIRRIDLHPPAPLPDAGTLHWEGSVLVEEGLHEAYVEHWERVAQSPLTPASALLEDPQEGCTGVLVRAGSWFGYARDRSVPLGTSSVALVDQVLGCRTRAEAAALLDCEVSIGVIRADDRWEIVRSTLPHRVGAQLAPRLNRAGDGLEIGDADRRGRPRTRGWQLTQTQGPVSLLALGPAGG